MFLYNRKKRTLACKSAMHIYIPESELKNVYSVVNKLSFPKGLIADNKLRFVHKNGGLYGAIHKVKHLFTFAIGLLLAAFAVGCEESVEHTA